MIRPYVCYLQNGWDQYLDQHKFGYKHSKRASHGQIPFMVAYGQHPTTVDYALAGPPTESLEPPATQDLLEARARARGLAHYSITQSDASMITTENTSRRDELTKVHDMILLSTRYLRLTPGFTRVKKLHPGGSVPLRF
jgi:hypothetical protein